MMHSTGKFNCTNEATATMYTGESVVEWSVVPNVITFGYSFPDRPQDGAGRLRPSFQRTYTERVANVAPVPDWQTGSRPKIGPN